MYGGCIGTCPSPIYNGACSHTCDFTAGPHSGTVTVYSWPITLTAIDGQEHVGKLNLPVCQGHLEYARPRMADYNDGLRAGKQLYSNN